MDKSIKKIFTYVVFGLLLGLLFPVIGTTYIILTNGQEFTYANFLYVHASQPLFWIIDSAPLVLALFTALVGRQAMRFKEVSLKLEEKVAAQRHQIQREHQFFDALITNSPFAVVQLDIAHRVIAFNQAFENLFGFEASEISGQVLDELVASDEMYTQAVNLSQMVTAGEMIREVGQRRKKDGGLIDVEIFGVPVVVGGEKVGALALYNDITAQKMAEQAMEQSEARLRNLFDQSPISLWEEDFSAVKRKLDELSHEKDIIERLVHDQELIETCVGLVKILDVNQATLDMFKAVSKDALLGGLAEVLPEESLQAFRNELIALANGETTYRCEIAQRRLDGELLYGLLQLSLPPGYEDSWERVYISIVDISIRKQAEEKLRYISYHDALTGVYNRAYFQEEMTRLEGSRQFPISIIMCDLDNLKQINDTYGHSVGDAALKGAAKILSETFRKEDFVARLGGDEFAVILPHSDSEEATSISERMKLTIANYNSNEDEELFRPISFSVGCATVSIGASLQEGYKLADERMYYDKLRKKK